MGLTELVEIKPSVKPIHDYMTMIQKLSQSTGTYLSLAVSAVLASVATLHRGVDIFYQALPIAPFVGMPIYLAYHYRHAASNRKTAATPLLLPPVPDQQQKGHAVQSAETSRPVEAPSDQKPEPLPKVVPQKPAHGSKATPDPFTRIKQHLESGADLRLLQFNEKEVSLLTGRSVSSLQKDRMRSNGIPYHKERPNGRVRYHYLEIIDYIQKDQ